MTKAAAHSAGVPGDGERDGREHDDGGSLAADLDGERLRLLGARPVELFEGQEREQVGGWAAGIEALARRLVQGTQVGDDGGFQVAERRAEQQ